MKWLARFGPRCCVLAIAWLSCAACIALPDQAASAVTTPHLDAATSSPALPVSVPITATPTAISPQRCPDAPPSQLIVHERGQVTRNNQRLNLREGPSLEHRVVILLDEGLVFFVLAGPICRDGFAWYHVRARGRTGWIAEGDATQYYAEPYLTG